MSSIPTSKGWVLYDDACGFCRRWMPFWAPVIRRRGYAMAPLQEAWVREKTGKGEAFLMEDLTLLFPDGRLIQGADVYRHLMSCIWWTYPLFLLASAPGLRGIFNWGYRTFARNRYRFSTACGLPGKHS
jgi:predicted DCC family thiol-disulfide oxidoreductase YuxK